MFRLVSVSSDHPARDLDPLASRSLPGFLVLEVAPGRETSDSRRVQSEIRRMAAANPAWGCRRIAAELNLKLGLDLSPRTVRKYLPKRPRPGHGKRDQRWSTFVRNHARVIVACDFVVSRTALFRTVYTFVVMEIASRRILHVNSTAHPTAAWTTQQLREVFAPEHPWKYLLRDRDSIFSEALDATVHSLGVDVLKSPPRCPKANASASASSERFAASVSTGSFLSAKGTSDRSPASGSLTTIADAHTRPSAPSPSRTTVCPPPDSLTTIACRKTHSSWARRCSAVSITNTHSSARRKAHLRIELLMWVTGEVCPSRPTSWIECCLRVTKERHPGLHLPIQRTHGIRPAHYLGPFVTRMEFLRTTTSFDLSR
jgi:hypothetical protein